MCGIVCVILCLAASVEDRMVTDKTDVQTHHHDNVIALERRRAVLRAVARRRIQCERALAVRK